MSKKLLSKNYNSFILECFTLPNRDMYKYYQNIFEEHYLNNPDIFQELSYILNGWIDWYKSQVYGKYVTVIFDDGIEETINENQQFEYDENGVRKPINIEITEIPLPQSLNIIKSVNREFFDYQLEIIQLFEKLNDFRKKLIDIENDQPEILRKALKTVPFPFTFEYEEIKKRSELLMKLPEFTEYILEYYNNIISQQENNNPDQPATSFDCTLTEPHLQKLFNELKSDENKFIHSETSFEQFRALFEAKTIEGINRVKWIDKPDKNNSIINAKTLFELLYLLKERDSINNFDFDTVSHNGNNLYKKINHCFSDEIGNDIKDLRSKCPFKAEKNTDRKKLLAEILTNSIK